MSLWTPLDWLWTLQARARISIRTSIFAKGRIESRLDGPDDYNNVQVISLDAERVASMTQQSNKIIVSVTRRSLTTSMQPVSIVVTGGFDWSAVVVNDDTSKNEKDVPKGIPIDTNMIIGIVIILVTVILVAA